MATLSEEFESVEKQIEDAVAYAVINLHDKLVEAAPVGDPALWKVNRNRKEADYYKPKGYVGGMFKASWKNEQLDTMKWKIWNDMEYASALWRGHSWQWNGGDAMLLKANKDLEREFKRIRA